MERISKFRAAVVLVLFSLILSFFGWKLFDEQIVQTGGGKTDNLTTFTTMTRVKAARGDILDRNGNVLVGNRTSYDLVINHFVLTNAENTNEHLYRLVKLCQQREIEIEDSLPISRETPFTYTLSQHGSTAQGYFQSFLEYRGGLDSDISAPLLMETLRDSYDIPAEWTDEEARLVLGLRYELSLRFCVGSLGNYVFLSDTTDEDRAAILELNIPGMNVEGSSVREYHTAYAAHILGIVSSMSPDQWAYYQNVDGYSMDSMVGQSGFELAFEEYLHGTDGWRVDEVTSDGTLVSSYYEVEPKSGNNVEVTIDLNLQIAAEEALAEVVGELKKKAETNPSASGADVEGAAVVAIDTRTGQVLACASYPTYNPATFHEDYNMLMEAEDNPMYDRALLATYPPGSTFKPCMVIAGIDSNTIDMYTEIEDKGVFTKYQGLDLNCLEYSRYGTTHGYLNATDALKVSCNYFFYELGDRMKIEDMTATAKNFGLGEPTGVEVYENTGYRASPETKQLLYSAENAGWSSADKVTAAIGQSDNRFTPMQLAVYASTLANRGTRYKATFLNRVVSADYSSLVLESKREILSQFTISDEAYEAYSQGMRLVASDPNGTAYRVFGSYSIPVAAKTGTAETGNPSASDNGAFICYAPANDPRIAIAVYGEKAGGGSTMGPVARAIMDVYFDDVSEITEVVTQENRP